MISPSELIINADGSVFHLHLRPEQLADRVILVGDPARVSVIAKRFESQTCEVCNFIPSLDITRANASRWSHTALAQIISTSY